MYLLIIFFAALACPPFTFRVEGVGVPRRNKIASFARNSHSKGGAVFVRSGERPRNCNTMSDCMEDNKIGFVPKAWYCHAHSEQKLTLGGCHCDQVLNKCIHERYFMDQKQYSFCHWGEPDCKVMTNTYKRRGRKRS